MKHHRTHWMLLGLLALMALGQSACVTSSRSGNVYSREQARVVQTAVSGTVEKVDAVQIEGTKSGLGAAAGGVAGGVAGSTIGQGRGSTLAAVGGVLVGAVAGHLAEEGLTSAQGIEVTVRTDDGRVVVVVQEADMSFSPGQRVRLISAPDGSARVRPE